MDFGTSKIKKNIVNFLISLNSNPNLSIRKKILLLYGCIVVLPIIILGIIAGQVLMQSLRSDYRNSLVEAVEQVAKNVEFRKQKYTYSAGEEFSADIEIAYYGRADLKEGILEWDLYDYKNKSVISGVFSPVYIKQGTVTCLGKIVVKLSPALAAEKITLELRIRGRDIVNHYSVWVYPAEDISIPDDIKVCSCFDEKTENLLAQGGKVLFMPDANKLKYCVGGMFASDFWCYPMFKNICSKMGRKPSPGTLGILCDPEHPALKFFPTEFHSNWQWWQIVMNSYPIILDGAPKDFRPIIQVIDNFERSHRLGLIFETQVGEGRLLVCSSNLTSCADKIEVRQLLYSLLRYMQSDDFKPDVALDPALLYHK